MPKSRADDALLDEVTALVEWPAVYEGGFSEAFLEVPPECLVLSMKQHQKYLPAQGPARRRELLAALSARLEPADGRPCKHRSRE